MARYRKLLVAAAGIVAQIINLNLVAGSLRDWLIVVLAAATAAGVYAVPNVQLPLPSPQPPSHI